MHKVITFGVFDYFHLGHLRLFKNSKKHGDYLIVAVQNGDYIQTFKPDHQTLYSTEERVEMLKELRTVDEVIVYDAISIEFISKIDFDVLILGEDHTQERFRLIEKWCQEHGKEVVRLKRTKGISSTSIKEQIK